jgi:hypothetical protein
MIPKPRKINEFCRCLASLAKVLVRKPAETMPMIEPDALKIGVLPFADRPREP